MAAYQKLSQSGKLRERLKAAVSLLESCSVCPRHCAVNRLEGDAGECCTSREAMVFSYGPHFGEEAPELAADLGLCIPLVYNSGGYDSVETLRILDGIIDIDMPDMKYNDEEIARQLSGIDNYPEINKAAIEEMHRQVGDLEINEDGVAQRGLFVRHLVLPYGLAGTKRIVEYLSKEISPDTYVNIMSQYHPCHKAFQIQSLYRRISSTEFRKALFLTKESGLTRLDKAVIIEAFHPDLSG